MESIIPVIDSQLPLQVRLKTIFTYLKRALSRSALEELGVDFSRIKQCPLHPSEGGRNLKLFKDGAYCFSCGRKFDFVNLYALSKGISNTQAAFDLDSFVRKNKVRLTHDTGLQIPAKSEDPITIYFRKLGEFQIDDDLRNSVFKRYRNFGCQEMGEKSPLRRVTAATVLDRCFKPDEHICATRTKYGRCIWQVTKFVKLADTFTFCIPSPIIGNGRTRADIGARRFLVLEQDHDRYQFDVQARLIWYLKERGFPLVLVCWSGGKGLHAWFKVEGWPLQRVFRLMTLGVRLGFDKPSFKPEQLIRLPGGYNYKHGKRQRVLFYNL